MSLSLESIFFPAISSTISSSCGAYSDKLSQGSSVARQERREATCASIARRWSPSEMRLFCPWRAAVFILYDVESSSTFTTALPCLRTSQDQPRPPHRPQSPPHHSHHT